MAREAKKAQESAPESDRALSPHQATTAAAQATSLVPMKRDAGQFPPPHTADVHPAEVANYAAGGWTFA